MRALPAEGAILSRVRLPSLSHLHSMFFPKLLVIVYTGEYRFDFFVGYLICSPKVAAEIFQNAVYFVCFQ